jgi:hypothetical protein
MTVIRIAIIPVLMILVSGCVTAPGYDRFYHAETNATVSCVAYSNVVVQVFKTDDELTSAYCRALDNGAILLGQAAWGGPYTDPDQAKRRATSVGANLVLVSIGYSHTRTGSISLPQYHPGSSTTYSTHNSGTVSGYGGSAQYSGNSTTTAYSPGYTTYNNIPYSVDRYDHWALFLHFGLVSKPPLSESSQLPISEEDSLGIDAIRSEILSDPSNPTNKENHIVLGNTYMAYRHYPEAIAEYQASLKMDSTNLYSMNKIGFALRCQNKFDEAMGQYNGMLQIAPNSAYAHYGLAQCYFQGKNDKIQAENHWKIVLNLCSKRNDRPSMNLKARCHWGLALAFYFDKKSLAIGSDHAYQAGKLFIECDEKKGSLQMVDLIKSYDPSSPLASRLTEYIYSKEENTLKSLPSGS